jgi:hypothetical protein
MRNRRHGFSALLSLLVLGGCTTASPEAFDRRIAALIGQPEAEAVAALGVPQRSYEGDGRRLLHYEFAGPAPGPILRPGIGLGFGTGGWGSGWGVGTGIGIGLGGQAAAAPCVLVLESREGRITGFRRSGPGCALPAG